MNEIIKKNGVNAGVFAGVVTIIVYLLVYFIDVKLLAEWYIGVGLIIFYIAYAVITMSKTKKQLNGIYPFKDAFTTYFIYTVVGMLISIVFSYILFNFIDTQAAETIKEVTIEKTVALMQKMQLPASELEKIVSEMQKQNTYSLGNLLKSSAGSLIFSIIIGLILALIFRSKPQVE